MNLTTNRAVRFLQGSGWLLRVSERLYRSGVQARHGLYRSGALRVRHLNHPVISIGNLSVGGTGKSPLVAYFALLLGELGYAPAVLSRGYRGTAESKNRIVSDGSEVLANPGEAGDEAWMLARQLPGVLVVVGRVRWISGRMVEQRFPSPQRVFLLDDGFQHLALHRNLDLVAVDATRPFASERMLPAGRLREPVSALQRADAILLTRIHQVPDRLESLKAEIRRMNPEIPIFGFSTCPQGCQNISTGKVTPRIQLIRRNAVAVAALGNPQQYLNDLTRAGLKIVNEFLFPDHHAFLQSEIDTIVERSRRMGAEFVVTTAKDAARLSGLDLRGLPFLAMQIRFETDDRADLLQWLEGRLSVDRSVRNRSERSSVRG